MTLSTTTLTHLTGLLEFRCPRCKGPLEEGPQCYRCIACRATYPVVLGIPDFRVFPDPYIGYEDDRAKGRQVVSGMDGASFADLVRRYWELTPDVPRHLVDRYVGHVLGAVVRAQITLAEARAACVSLGATAAAGNGRLLEVGCGTGGLLIAAARDYEQVIGVDIAFRWLAIASRRIQESVATGELTQAQAARIRLVCGCAENLPLPDGAFDLVIAAGVLEHTARQADLLRQAGRALRPGGLLFLTTVNRFSLAPEPHVQVWGVGFLPRRWMGAYVQRLRGVPYRHIRLVSASELIAQLRRAGFARWEVQPPSLSQADVRRYSPGLRMAAWVYHRLRQLPGSRRLLSLFGPLLQAAAVVPGSDLPVAPRRRW